MPCAFCGEGDKWIKTCRTKDGSRLRVCDPCWEALGSWLVIVPGDGVVTARCDGCGGYFNPREMAEFSPGGRYNAYTGTCWACAKVGAACRSEVPTLDTYDLGSTLGTPGIHLMGSLFTGGTGGKRVFAGPHTFSEKVARGRYRVASSWELRESPSSSCNGSEFFNFLAYSLRAVCEITRWVGGGASRRSTS